MVLMVPIAVIQHTMSISAKRLGMLLGVRLWYGFCGPVLESEGAFEGKVDELCQSLSHLGLCGTHS